MSDNNKNDNNINTQIPIEQKNIIMKNLIKENEILSKVIKGKLGHNEAHNELLKIMNEQRNFIENISEEHLMLEKSVTRLNTSIDIHTSFLKSLEILAARIPAQCMQSFMSMKIVGFEESGLNVAYVSRA
jgi:hypothetical protein